MKTKTHKPIRFHVGRLDGFTLLASFHKRAHDLASIICGALQRFLAQLLCWR
jgi:hypothetical protein